MLRIAAVGNTYKDVKAFVEYKFKDKIDKVSMVRGVYTLKNGDEVYLCHGEGGDIYKYKGMEYDAYVVSPIYQSLLDVIQARATRPF